MNVDETWTGREEERQDCVDNLIFELMEAVVPEETEIEWDIEDIAEIRDVLESIIVDKLSLMTSYDFYPYRQLDDESEPEVQAGFVISDRYGKMTHLVEDSVGGLDAQEFGDLVGELFGGTCRFIGDYKYMFTPNSDYQGGLDDIKED